MVTDVYPIPSGDRQRALGVGAAILVLAVTVLACATVTLAQNNDKAKAGLTL